MDDPNERFDRLLRAMLSGPPPSAKGKGEAHQEQSDLPSEKHRRNPKPRS